MAESLSNLAILYNQRGDYAKAQPLYERALAIWEKTQGPDHPDVAHTLTDLAVLHLEQVSTTWSLAVRGCFSLLLVAPGCAASGAGEGRRAPGGPTKLAHGYSGNSAQYGAHAGPPFACCSTQSKGAAQDAWQWGFKQIPCGYAARAAGERLPAWLVMVPLCKLGTWRSDRSWPRGMWSTLVAPGAGERHRPW